MSLDTAATQPHERMQAALADDRTGPSGGGMNDKVFILGLRADAVIGVYDWERDIRQPLEFDIEIATDITAAAAGDDLTKAVDYAAISKRVLEEVEATSFQLIESLAEHLATMILQFEDVIMGSYSGSLMTFIKQRVIRRNGTDDLAKEMP